MESKFRVKFSLLLTIILIAVAHLQVSSGCLEDERLSLLDIKAFFLSHKINKDSENIFGSWVGDNCCNWDRVHCNNLTSRSHVVDLLLNQLLDYHFRNSNYGPLNVSLFQNFKELKRLDLSYNEFSDFTENQGFNKFPSLNKLETLNLSGNYFGNKIISSLTGFTSLKNLVLSRTGLEGSITLPGLENLRELYLNANDLNGILPVQGLERLEVLDLGSNHFNKSILSSIRGLVSLKTLKLYNSNFSIPTQDIAKLKSLEILDLSDSNYFDGPISLEGLENLRELYLRYNNINGRLHLQGLERLETLHLEENKFNNSIFSSLRELISLKTLILYDNDLGGIIPTQDIAKLKSLEILDLSYNNYYDGAIPLQDLKNLKVLVLNDNQFNGSLPIQGFCETNSLVELSIEYNHIRGELSQCIGNFTRLRLLDISSNQFSGKIPATILNLTSIEYLSLADNDFEGPFLLSSLANHTNLQFFELSKIQVDTEKHYWIPMFQLKFLTLRNCELNKQTTSNIPSFLLSQRNLISIDLSHNQLVGTFPVWLLHNNSELRFLDLSSNSLTGTLQLPTWKLKLLYLRISNNNFSGQLPKNVCLLSDVYYFNISSNNFEGNLPPTMEHMKDLYYLDLSKNKFSGNLQISMFNNMSHLKCLLLGSNNFSGSIKYGWNNANLITMDISNNMISGKVPSWIGNLKNLQYLQISRNLFEGELPDRICYLHELRFLDVSQNQLFGVPSCLNFSSLIYLYMPKNLFSGTIPHAFSNGSNLKVLDLSYNNFSGPIPNWIHKLTSLRVLLLKMNQLQGSIPQQLCQVGKLSMVDFSNNKLSGSIPSCLNNISFGMIRNSEYSTIQKAGDSSPVVYTQPTSFESRRDYFLNQEWIDTGEQIEVDFTTKSRFETYKGSILEFMSGLDLSQNQLTGNIPLQMGDLLQIHALNFSHNKLVGPIPKEISNLQLLESLDLSNNFLSGNIPFELGGLNSLAIFDVSYNNLSGMIPTSPHFSTYPASSYYGNYHLCGSYIEQKCPSFILPPENQSLKLEEEDGAFIDLEAFYWSFAASYIIILMGLVAILYINPHWRQTWFYFIEDCCSYFCKCI